MDLFQTIFAKTLSFHKKLSPLSTLHTSLAFIQVSCNSFKCLQNTQLQTIHSRFSKEMCCKSTYKGHLFPPNVLPFFRLFKFRTSKSSINAARINSTLISPDLYSGLRKQSTLFEMHRRSESPLQTQRKQITFVLILLFS